MLIGLAPEMMRPLTVLLAILLLSGCAGSPDYVYRYRPGKTATLHGGIATAPSQAPPRVRAAIAAGNRIAG